MVRTQPHILWKKTVSRPTVHSEKSASSLTNQQPPESVSFPEVAGSLPENC